MGNNNKNDYPSLDTKKKIILIEDQSGKINVVESDEGKFYLEVHPKSRTRINIGNPSSSDKV